MKQLTRRKTVRKCIAHLVHTVIDKTMTKYRGRGEERKKGKKEKRKKGRKEEKKKEKKKKKRLTVKEENK